jgi:hypothetical protein
MGEVESRAAADAEPLDELERVRRSGDAEGPPRPSVAREAYDPTRDREAKRGQIALRLLTLLTLLTFAPFALALARGLCVRVAGLDACSGFPDVNVTELMQLVFTPVVALVGAATGFYFGEKKG